MNQVVRDFRGEKIRIECEEKDVPEVVYNVLVAPFASDYEKGWMANSAIETHIKNYLSYAGSLMIRRPDDFNIVSDRKQRKIRGMEISTDAIDKPKIKATPAPTSRKKKNTDTRGKRLDVWVRKYPTADIWYCRVDTDSMFDYFGRRFHLDDSVCEYAGIPVGKDDMFYPMDQVIVVDTGNGLVFLNQSAELIDREKIREVLL